VRVGNRGTAPVNGITVRVWVTSTNPDVWNTTGDWQPLLIGGQAISAPTGAPLLPGGEIEIGPFAWQPVAGLRQALIIATDAPGDASLLDLAGDLACTQGPTAVADLIPFDNNLGYRVWTLP
jgi:hypothetical protein